MMEKALDFRFFIIIIIFFCSSNGEKYGGCPRELPVNDLPTYADVARYFYIVSEKNKDFKKQVKIVKKN